MADAMRESMSGEPRSGETPTEADRDLLLAGLTDEQREAVTSDATPLLVVAGAGSGKTRVLTRRIAWQAAAANLDPRRVLAVTFTRKAASELRQRLSTLGFAEDVTAGTFHALAFAQLRRHWTDRGHRVPKLLDRKTRLLARLLARHPGTPPSGASRSGTRFGERRGALAGAAAREIEWAQARLVGPDDYESIARQARRTPPLPPAEMADLYARYAAEKQRRGLIDFDDLLNECAALIERDAEIAAAMRWRYRHVFVDEFQDVNPAQFRLLEAWLGDQRDLFAVGDDDQAIYGFGGADAHYLTAFADHFGPDASIVRLTANFRSTPEILALANAINRPSPADERRLRATTAEGPLPSLTAYDDDLGEAEAVAASIERLRTEGIGYRDVAVLARTNAQLTVIDEVLTARRVPVRRRGATRFLDDPVVEHVLTRLLREHEGTTGPAGQLFESALRDAVESAPDPDAPALRVLRELGEEFGALEGDEAGGPAFREFVAASVRDEDPIGSANAVDVLTFHRAKGLEWPVVFVTGVEDGFVPIAHAATEAARNEERRLLHVAFTRAERRLHVSWARRRTFRSASRPHSGREGGREGEGETTSERELSPFLVGVAPFLDDREPAEPRSHPETEHGRAVLQEAASRLRQSDPDTSSGLRPPPDPLLEALVAWRDRRARAVGVPPAAVLDDATLRAVSARRPQEPDDLADVPGLGASRVARYGPEIVGLVAEYIGSSDDTQG